MKICRRCLLLAFASLFLLAGLVLLFFIFAPVVCEEVKFFLQKNRWQNYQLVQPSPEESGSATPSPFAPEELDFAPALIKPVSFDFSLVIPRIGVNVLVFPEVDSQNEAHYGPVLEKGVAHARGSSLPSGPGPVFIFGHSTNTFTNIGRYHAVFYLLSKLETGDEIYLFYQNRQYRYLVTAQKIVSTDGVTPAFAALSGPQLVLQTCWPPGTTIRRLLVIAKPDWQ